MELLIADTTGIQSYIFGSNRLRENIGASYLVDQATGPWALALIEGFAPGRCNVRGGQLTSGWSLRDQGDVDGIEVIYAGGGNLLGLFGSADLAGRFERALSVKLLTDAPGLDLVCARRPFDPATGNLDAVLKDLFAELASTKQGRPRHLPLTGLGVTQACRSIGEPAVEVYELSDREGFEDRRPISAEIAAKLKVVEEDKPNPVEERLLGLLKDLDLREFAFPRDFADLGATKGEHSLLAVIHADGDGMGARIRDLARSAPDAWTGIASLRGFSAAVNQAGAATLQDIVRRVLDAIEWDAGEPFIRHPSLPELAIRLPEELDGDGRQTGRWCLPLRPLVYGGDDLTLVADGRLGLDLAVHGLRAFAAHTEHLPGGRGALTASGGVAIGKSSRPFARAYALAEELCHSAKTYRREAKLTDGCLDWHFATTAPAATLAELRAREYQVPTGNLTLRPVTLGTNPVHTGRGWPTVRAGIAAFQGEDWIDRRSKVKALREALRDGSQAVQWFRQRYLDDQPLPALCDPRGLWVDQGWDSQLCGYFDAIELYDRFITLDRGI